VTFTRPPSIAWRCFGSSFARWAASSWESSRSLRSFWTRVPRLLSATATAGDLRAFDLYVRVGCGFGTSRSVAPTGLVNHRTSPVN